MDRNNDLPNGDIKSLIYWLLLDIYNHSENVSRQTINKKFCLHFTDKTDDDVSSALKFLKNNKMIAVTDEEKEIFRITSQGGQAVQQLLNQFILDDIDLKFYSRYNNGVEANYVKQYRHSQIDEKDPFIKKLKVALENIKDFVIFIDAIHKFSPHIKDLWDLIPKG